MADYKRMVSYMYAYENGLKRKNVGFVRMETRNGQCKFTLHVQMAGQPDSIVPTYLIYRNNEDIGVVYLGDAIIKNQAVDSKLIAKEADINNAAKGLGKACGMILFINSYEFCATYWDDEKVDVNDILEALKPKKKPSNETKEEMVEKSETKPEVESEEKVVEEQELDKVEEDSKTLVEEVADNLFEEVKVGPATKAVEKPIEKIVETSVEEPVHQPVESLQGQDEEIPLYKLPGGYKFTQGVQREYKAKTQAVKEVDDKYFSSFPKVNPFEDKTVVRCAKMEPKDIGILPKEVWDFSNNSFLLHGYYSYKHIIFAKLIDQEGTRYILGVPGVFNNKEKFVAKMFGFTNFKSVKKQALRQGDFGYWYAPVKI